MAPQYKAGETVRYKPKSGPSSDAYEAEITGTIKNIQASQDDSRYEIENLSTGEITTIQEKDIVGKELKMQDIPILDVD
ncbi:hypothetical protein FA13DRAFT_1793004 [Coprinellus micaceus]|uniref:Hypervirulence associated protein TUDOR domain-containing protein n=1 Tax=Coprinellus micaceus TaxID=71717 RepID=A0A4Y7T813_COPMI|nr:hypothetical protein FA13DRAFT_1793004 [Coprinellus micaceus]